MEDVEDTKTKWRYFEEETLIALWGEMDEEFAKAANKQDKFFFHDIVKLRNFF